VVFSGNKGVTHSGGTCFGDSGGPVFEGDTNLIVAVTSFGITFNCVEPGGYYRIDQTDDLAFIGDFLN
jgi:secreted trypsin-like serine protease